jgi:hypothetical protein
MFKTPLYLDKRLIDGGKVASVASAALYFPENECSASGTHFR